MARRVLVIAGGVLATSAALLVAAVLWNYEEFLRSPSPGGEFELVTGESEPSSFFVVAAGSEPLPEDEVLRADPLGGCPEPPTGSAAPAPGERKVICSGAISFGWVSPTEVEFSISDSVHVVKQVNEAHGVRISVHRFR